ncbi:MAG: hypothetical protein Q8O83_05105, partial [bacterium]|nr:hypothetical protein [bacterium]
KTFFWCPALNEQAAGLASIFARARRNSPHTPLPPRPRFRRQIFSAGFVLFLAPPGAEKVKELPNA